MKIGCVYTVETYHSLAKPLSAATEIPFGISFIITVLEQNGFDVELFVITPDTDLSETLLKFIENNNPKLVIYDFGFCIKTTLEERKLQQLIYNLRL